MEKKEYNGWTNYETWVVNLWMSNDAETDNYWLNIADISLNDATASDILTKEENAQYTLSDTIKESLEEGNPIEEASFYRDLLTGAISEVNFDEIAKHLIERSTEIKNYKEA